MTTSLNFHLCIFLFLLSSWCYEHQRVSRTWYYLSERPLDPCQSFHNAAKMSLKDTKEGMFSSESEHGGARRSLQALTLVQVLEGWPCVWVTTSKTSIWLLGIVDSDLSEAAVALPTHDPSVEHGFFFLFLCGPHQGLVHARQTLYHSWKLSAGFGSLRMCQCVNFLTMLNFPDVLSNYILKVLRSWNVDTFVELSW